MTLSLLNAALPVPETDLMHAVLSLAVIYGGLIWSVLTLAVLLWVSPRRQIVFMRRWIRQWLSTAPRVHVHPELLEEERARQLAACLHDYGRSSLRPVPRGRG